MVDLCNIAFGELLSSIRAALKISVEDAWFLKFPTAFYQCYMSVLGVL